MTEITCEDRCFHYKVCNDNNNLWTGMDASDCSDFVDKDKCIVSTFKVGDIVYSSNVRGHEFQGKILSITNTAKGISMEIKFGKQIFTYKESDIGVHLFEDHKQASKAADSSYY